MVIKRDQMLQKKILKIDLNTEDIFNNKTNLSNIENTIKNHNTDIVKIPNFENDINTINSNIKDISNMKTSLNNLKYRQDGINIIVDKLTPLQDIVKNNTTNITNNYNISQISKKKSEFNTTLIDNHTNNIKTINSTLTDFENNLSDLKKGISDNNKLIQNNINLISSNKKVLVNTQLISFNYLKLMKIVIMNLMEIITNLPYQMNIFQTNLLKQVIQKYHITYVSVFYANLKNDYHRLNLTFEFYDNDKLIKSIINNTFNEGNNLLKSILYKSNLYIPLYPDVTKLRIKVLLTRYNLRGYGDINVSISNKNSNNFLYIKYSKQSF